MAAPKFAPVPVIGDVKSYRSPAFVPDGWDADRPGDLDGRQPSGPGLGFQGPDQGYALKLAARLRPLLVLSDAERVDDAVTGCTAIGMRRASSYGRAPVIHPGRSVLPLCVERAHICPDGRLNFGKGAPRKDALDRRRHFVGLRRALTGNERDQTGSGQDRQRSHAVCQSNVYAIRAN